MKHATWLAIPVIVLADQLSKAFVFAWLVDAPDVLTAWRGAEAGMYVRPVAITPFLNIVTVWNTGISFGMLNNGGYDLTYLLIGVAIAITLVLGIWLWREQGRLAMAALALVIGGALGNIIDRARLGAVFDFLDLHVAGYHWPAFNLADSCVVIGVALLIVDSIFLPKTNSRTTTP